MTSLLFTAVLVAVACTVTAQGGAGTVDQAGQNTADLQDQTRRAWKQFGQQFLHELQKGGSGNFLSSILGLGRGMGVPSIGAGMARHESQKSSADQTLNTWREWGQQATQGYRNWGRNFRQSMRTNGLDLARRATGMLQSSLQGAQLPGQVDASSLLAKALQSIPRI